MFHVKQFGECDMKMPFGKYKGEEVEDLPIRYLIWLKENTELYGDLEKLVDELTNDDEPRLI